MKLSVERIHIWIQFFVYSEHNVFASIRYWYVKINNEKSIERCAWMDEHRFTLTECNEAMALNKMPLKNIFTFDFLDTSGKHCRDSTVCQ